MYIPSVKNVTFSDEARNKLAQGVQKLTDAVQVTMGPKGRNVLLQKEFGPPVLTKDGVSVAQEIELKDPIENMGAQLVKEVSRNTATEAGDGTTTATVLACAIYQEGLRNITAGANPVEVKRGMDKILVNILDHLKSNSKEITSKQEIAQVATISANSDTEIGNLIAEAMERVGNDGVITVEEAKGIEDSLEVAEGMQIETGHLSPYFINNTEKMTTDLKNPLILISNDNIVELTPIVSLLEQVQQLKVPLLIIASGISSGPLSTLVANNVKNILDVTVIKAPGFGDTTQVFLDDLGVLTGAVVADSTTKKLSDITLEDLGSADKITIARDETIIQVMDNGVIDIRVQEIKTQLENSKNDFEKSLLKERIAKLTGGVGIIKVGAATETEMREKKDRIDDALGATKAAVEEGIIIGGGSALLNASKVKNSLKGDQKVGADIVLRALSAPIRQISVNAGYDAGVVINKVLKSKDTSGFNAATGKYVDMYKDGIIDSLKVARIALSNAISISSILLTTEAVVSIAGKD